MTDSVSISELMHMREVEGLSNGEIALRLGVHPNTICKPTGPHPDGKRAKYKRHARAEQAPPALPENKVVEVDQPKRSFVERCEAARQKAEKTLIEAIKEEPVFAKLQKMASAGPDGEAPSEADKAREAHCKEMANSTPYTTYKGTDNTESRSPLHELLAVFGLAAVRDYLRVSLYAMGIPYCREVKREHLLTALKTLNEEAIKID